MPKSKLEKAVERGAIIDVSVSDDMHTVKRWKLDHAVATTEERNAFFYGLQAKPFSKQLEELQSAVAARLLELGWPHPMDAVLHNCNQWRLKPEALDTAEKWKDFAAPGEKLSHGWAYAYANADSFSEAWFCAKIFKHNLEVLNHDGENRDMAIFQLGHTIAVAESRGLLDHVSRGKTTQKGASMGGTIRGEAMAEVRRTILEAMSELVQRGHSITRAADLAHNKGYGSSGSANRSTWYRHKESL